MHTKNRNSKYQQNNIRDALEQEAGLSGYPRHESQYV